MDAGALGRLQKRAPDGNTDFLPVGLKHHPPQARRFFRFVLGCPAPPALLHEPDGAGRSKLAVDVGILAFQTFFAQVFVVLHAQKIRFDVAVARTLTHDDRSRTIFSTRCLSLWPGCRRSGGRRSGGSLCLS